jgi:anaerobic magnesium-protoporphyrin IX monomethyl ester cyclase
MNVLLISPFRGALFGLIGVKMQPLGISYIGSALRAAGHDVQIQMLEDETAVPDFTGADVVGISCNTVQFVPGLKVAKLAKELGKIVIMGGPHPTSSPDEALKSGYVDYVVRAEGEVTSVELLEGLKAGRNFDPSKVLGISWIDKATGNIVHNPARPFVQDLDQLPFPMREADWRYGTDRKSVSRKKPDFPLITTRGCPYGCKFCDVHILAGKRFRTRSIDNITKEIEELIGKYNAERIVVVDDIINFDNERLIDLFDTLIRRNLDYVKWVMGRADHLIKDPETAEVMSAAGVEQMFIGIESPNERIIKAYKKGGKASFDTSLKAVELLKEHNIETWGAFILGEPSETMEDIKRTIEFAKEINPGTAQFTILTPYPGTDLWKEVESKIITRDWEKYDAMHSVFRHDNIGPKELEHAVLKAYMSFYTQPKRIFREMLKKNHHGRPDVKDVVRIVKGLKVVFGNH